MGSYIRRVVVWCWMKITVSFLVLVWRLLNTTQFRYAIFIPLNLDMLQELHLYPNECRVAI
jgi:hypothetical protein